MPCEALKNRAMIRIGGEEAAHFLNNLVTCDVAKAQEGTALFGGLLSPQGKILFEFFVIAGGDGFVLDVAHSLHDELLKRLMFYRLRAKVVIEPVEGMKIDAVWGDTPPQTGLAAKDSRHEEMGWRILRPAGEADEADIGTENYCALRVRLGIPEGGIDYAFGDAFPHDALYDQIGAVDFTKGCYVGQEVVSRMQHRSTARKRVVKILANSPLPATGSDIVSGTRRLGHVGSVAGNDGLAMLRLDRVKPAIDKGEAITAEGIALTVTLPDWVSFGWPQVAGEQ